MNGGVPAQRGIWKKFAQRGIWKKFAQRGIWKRFALLEVVG